jgi:hypothetical protein
MNTTGTVAPNGVLDELAGYVLTTVPQPAAVSNLLRNERANAVTFRWKDRDFFVKPSLAVFEVKGAVVFVTAASRLMQVALQKKRKATVVLETAVATLKQTEDFFNNGQTDKGFILLSLLKKTIAMQAGKPLPAPT